MSLPDDERVILTVYKSMSDNDMQMEKFYDEMHVNAEHAVSGLLKVANLKKYVITCKYGFNTKIYRRYNYVNGDYIHVGDAENPLDLED